MSLTAHHIEASLLAGISFTSNQREFAAKLDPKSDRVIINEMTRLARGSLPLEFVFDQAHANQSGSRLSDQGDLRNLLAELASRAV